MRGPKMEQTALSAPAVLVDVVKVAATIREMLVAFRTEEGNLAELEKRAKGSRDRLAEVRLAVGRQLVEARKAWPTHGPGKLAGKSWGEWLDGQNIDDRRAREWMALAGYVEAAAEVPATVAGTSASTRVPTLAESGVKKPSPPARPTMPPAPVPVRREPVRVSTSAEYDQGAPLDDVWTPPGDVVAAIVKPPQPETDVFLECSAPVAQPSPARAAAPVAQPMQQLSIAWPEKPSILARLRLDGMRLRDPSTSPQDAADIRRNIEEVLEAARHAITLR